MRSCIYAGDLHHVRWESPTRRFRYRVRFAYLDLSELDELFAGSRLWSVEGRTPVAFRRRDYLSELGEPSDPRVPLDRAVRRLVAARTGVRPAGAIRLLSLPSYFGHSFNPASFYFCFSEDDRRLDALVVEVTNLPGRGRHCYVIDLRGQSSEPLRARHDKAFPVSPFLAMNHEYDWQIRLPGQHLRLAVSNRERGARVFHASLDLERVEITRRSLRAVFWRDPLQSARLLAAIYGQALRLRWALARRHPQQGDAGPYAPAR